MEGTQGEAASCGNLGDCNDAERILHSLLYEDNAVSVTEPTLDFTSDTVLEELLGPLEVFTTIPLMPLQQPPKEDTPSLPIGLQPQLQMTDFHMKAEDEGVSQDFPDLMVATERERVGAEIHRVSAYAPTAALQPQEALFPEGDDVLAALAAAPVIVDEEVKPMRRGNQTRTESKSSDEGICLSPGKTTVVFEELTSEW